MRASFRAPRFGGSSWMMRERAVPVSPFEFYNCAMPRISEFFGIIIRMYYREHPPPHFHAKVAEHTASYSINTLALIEGDLPRRAHGLVLEWAALHREERRENWERAQGQEPLLPIAPLE